jgi:hypothetical protein
MLRSDPHWPPFGYLLDSDAVSTETIGVLRSLLPNRGIKGFASRVDLHRADADIQGSSWGYAKRADQP